MGRISLQNTFQSGQTTDATKMNTNFTTISSEVNGNLDDQNIANAAELTVDTVTAAINTPNIQGGSSDVVIQLKTASTFFRIKDSSGNELLKVGADSSDGITFGKKYVSKFHSIGTVLMFNGAGWVDNSTMLGWYQCDGNNGTPNLVDKFIRCSTTSGSTGGSDDAIAITHTHTKTVGNESDTHTHPSVADTNSTEDMDHTHTVTVRSGSSGSGSNVAGIQYTSEYDTTTSQHMSTRTGTHNHEWDSGASTIGNNSANHTHTVSFSTDGVSATDANMPAYYSLIFIIRTS